VSHRDQRLRSFQEIADRDSFLQEFHDHRTPDIPNSESPRSSSAPLRLKPCATFPRSNGCQNFTVSSTNPGHRFLLLEDSFRRLKLPSQNLSSDNCTGISCSNFSRPKNSWLSFNETTKVLYLLSLSTLIHSEGIYAHSSRSMFNNFSSVESF
jgi:hypothetical protein